MATEQSTPRRRTLSLGAGSEGNYLRLRPNLGFTIGGTHWCAFGGFNDRKRVTKLRARLEAAGWTRQGDRWFAPKGA